jgi:hypothetical protein
VRYEFDEAKEWMTIIVDIKKNINLKYIKFKIDDKGKWEDIPKNELKFTQYVWRIHGAHKLIVEYKIGNKIETIEKPFSIEHGWISYGQQLDDIVVLPDDGSETNNSMVPIDIYLHKRIGDIEEIQVLLDGKKIKPEISDYSFGKVAEYIPEEPYQNGKHSVLVKVKTTAGKKIEKRIEFEIKPSK